MGGMSWLDGLRQAIISYNHISSRQIRRGKRCGRQTFSGSGNTTGRSVQQTTDGGYIIAGQDTTDKTKVYLLKTDASGTQQWSKTYGGGSVNLARSAYQTADGGYIVFATTLSQTGTQLSALSYLLKTDASGTMQWEKILPCERICHCYCRTEDC